MKLTPELLAQAQSGLNATKERELDLRGYKIPAIENLGVSKDQHDCIDFTDNSIQALANLPLLRRLRTLLLANNRISTISVSIHISAPNLTSLVLTNNNFTELGDLEPLKELRFLQYLSLLGNPVREKKWYREWLVHRLPALRVLDFQRIRDKQRALFLTADNLPTALANTLSSTVPKQAQPALKGRLMSKEDAERVKAAIAKASSIDEIRRLELSLREGLHA
ncbi:leucine-rich repeat-domain-containing protein [Flagelloscypha sp. PMI_526]|nr:leucine-rich repeat-domain-containing protein [Flagelloscypha sp. PMI_526]